METNEQQALDLGDKVASHVPAQPAKDKDFVAEVAVDAPGRDSYSYAIPDELMDAVAVGDAVDVPYGRQRLKGFVLRRHAQPPAGVRLRAIIAHRPDCHLPGDLLRLIAWASRYYRCHLGVFLAAAVPAAVRKGVQMRAQKILLKQADADVTGLTKRQQAVYEALPSEPIPLADALRQAATTRPVLQKLIAAQALSLVEERDISDSQFSARDERHSLTDEQEVAKQAILAGIERQEHETFLLYGVTGSGKTLVYMEVAQRVIDAGQQVLMLLPEISLRPNSRPAFAIAFRGLPSGTRAFPPASDPSNGPGSAGAGWTWSLVPARPYLRHCPNLAWSSSMKSTTARTNKTASRATMAATWQWCTGSSVRSRWCLAPATPSFESYQNVLQGRYTALTMRQRPKGGTLPTASLVNMRDECKVQGRFALLSTTLIERIRESKERDEQAIILLNRRGWSPIVSCQSCGHTIMCPHCDIGMTYHRGESKLRCHYCDHEMPHPDRCPACGEPGLTTKGLGTEQLESLLQSAIPGLRTIRIDADTVGKKHAHGDLLAQFAAGKADCLVGTQMVAKGLDFARVTTVGVVQADRGLGIPDFRAAERTFQLIAQVAGRAGRGDHPGMWWFRPTTPTPPPCAVHCR